MGNAIGAQAFVDGQLAANTHFTKAEVHALHGAFSGGHTMLLDKEAFKGAPPPAALLAESPRRERGGGGG